MEQLTYGEGVTVGMPSLPVFQKFAACGVRLDLQTANFVTYRH